MCLLLSVCSCSTLENFAKQRRRWANGGIASILLLLCFDPGLLFNSPHSFMRLKLPGYLLFFMHFLSAHFPNFCAMALFTCFFHATFQSAWHDTPFGWFVLDHSLDMILFIMPMMVMYTIFVLSHCLSDGPRFYQRVWDIVTPITLFLTVLSLLQFGVSVYRWGFPGYTMWTMWLVVVVYLLLLTLPLFHGHTDS